MEKKTSKVKMTLKKTVCLITAFLLTFGTALGSYEANAKETQQSLQNKIDNAQNQIDENNDKKSDIEDDMATLEEKIDKAESEVNALESEVAEANSNLQKAANELEEGNQALNNRLRTMYKSGSMGFIDVILSSENVSDLMNNFSMVQYIFKNDKDIVSELQKQHETLSAMTKTLQEKQSELNAKQEALNDDYSALADARSEIQSENAELNRQIEDWRADSAALEDIINDAQGGNSGSSGGGYKPPPSVSGQGFGWPCSGTITREFGAFDPPWDVIPHLGMDIAVPSGTAIRASKAGQVIYAGWQGTYGNLVVIDHGNGISTAYAHNSGFAVSVGQTVSKGQTIAYAGSTGNSSGPHCHFEVRVNGKAVNPRNYL